MKFLPLVATIASATEYLGPCDPGSIIDQNCQSSTLKDAGTYCDAGEFCNNVRDNDCSNEVVKKVDAAKYTNICRDNSKIGPNIQRRVNDVSQNFATKINSQHACDRARAVPVPAPYACYRNGYNNCGGYGGFGYGGCGYGGGWGGCGGYGRYGCGNPYFGIGLGGYGGCGGGWGGYGGGCGYCGGLGCSMCGYGGYGGNYGGCGGGYSSGSYPVIPV